MKKIKRRGVPYHIPVTLDKAALGVAPEALMTDVKHLLLGRFTIKGGNMFLDGNHAHLGEIVREANRILASRGFKQLGRNPQWFV